MEWWNKYFTADYLKLYGHTEQKAPSEVAGILRMLQIRPPASILDLCCGFGRHAIVLAGEGFEVTGLDLSESFLRMAKQRADLLGVRLDLIQADMRHIKQQEAFDAIINLFTAFGFFSSEEEDLQVLQGVSRALKKDGQFLIDTVNRDNIIHSLQPKRWSIDNGTVVLEERIFDFFKSRLEINLELVQKEDKNRRLEYSFRLYTLTEMLNLFSKTGLELTDVYGDFDGSQYSAESPRMLLVARKKT
jgi:cyclopropane fatty-acyl-phospholipid synthase-like methyltransferase